MGYVGDFGCGATLRYNFLVRHCCSFEELFLDMNSKKKIL